MAKIFQLIKFEVKESVVEITLNRPEKRNALSPELIAELTEAFDLAANEAAVRVVVLKAEGKVFCAGADLEYLQKLSTFNLQENLLDSNQLKLLFYKIYSLPKIVIAQVHGHAIAGGAGLATVCDYVYAVPEANFGYTEVKLGFIPALVSIFLLRKIGEGRTRELLLSGELISASRALEIGLISEIVLPEELDKSVKEFAQNIVQNTSSNSIASTKVLLAKAQSLSLEEGLSYAAEMNAKTRESQDFKKGIQAFLNKQTPKWG